MGVKSTCIMWRQVLHSITSDSLQAIEAKQITGNYDAALHLKAQVDNLTGRNEELRRELREARVEGSRAKLELERATSKVSLAASGN